MSVRDLVAPEEISMAPPAADAFPMTRQSSTSSSRRLMKQNSSVGFLCRALPEYVQKPPIEAVVFGWGVNEDGQLVCTAVIGHILFCAACHAHHIRL